MRNACSTQSTYSDGVSRPIMSVRLRMSVLRLRQLSAIDRRLYDSTWRAHKLDQRGEIDLFVLGQVRAETAARVLQLPCRPLTIAVLRTVARRHQMQQPAHELIVAEAEDVLERVRSPPPLAAFDVPLGAPQRRPVAGVRRRPLVLVLFFHAAPILDSARGGLRGGHRPGSQRRAHRARHRDARRLRLHALRRGNPPLRVHAGLPEHARLLHAAAPRHRLRRLRGPGRNARRAQPAARRARRSASAPTATRTATAASTTGRWASSRRSRSAA